jgi:PIN domain nuclease of toxin-antitoxin system
MALLLDTQMLVWIGMDDPRLRRELREAIADPLSQNFVSAVTAFEFTDLHVRGRFGEVASLSAMVDRLDLEVLPFPAECWKIIERLPRHHRDPVDRMLVAHAIHADLTLLSADETIRRYPVRVLW